MGRYLHIAIARLNKAIAEYSLARLEFTLTHPNATQPPVLGRVGGRTPADARATRGWAETMKRIATLKSYVDTVRAADPELGGNPAFARLTKAANEVALLAWNMESMHRRGGGRIS